MVDQPNTYTPENDFEDDYYDSGYQYQDSGCYGNGDYDSYEDSEYDD